MTKKKKTDPKPTPPAAIDKSETLARVTTPGGGEVTIETHPFKDDGPPFVLATDTKPIRIGSGSTMLAMPLSQQPWMMVTTAREVGPRMAT